MLVRQYRDINTDNLYLRADVQSIKKKIIINVFIVCLYAQWKLSLFIHMF